MTFPHRTFCDTVAEMRRLVDSMSIFSYMRNKAVLKSLIEECQTYGNRMEAALTYQKDIDALHKQLKEGRKRLKDDVLRREIDA